MPPGDYSEEGVAGTGQLADPPDSCFPLQHVGLSLGSGSGHFSCPWNLSLYDMCHLPSQEVQNEAFSVPYPPVTECSKDPGEKEATQRKDPGSLNHHVEGHSTRPLVLGCDVTEK